jgi:RNA polymerase sigma-B factor
MTHATVAASPVATVRARERAGRCARTDRVLLLLSVAGPEEHGRLIDELITANMPVAESIAARYRRRGIPDEDLEQVAYLALVRVARDYDPSRGRDFLA